jgi:hypothetical protein
LAERGWANESYGDAASPTGWFARISNADIELPEILDAFSEELASTGLSDPNLLLGNFLVVHKDEQPLQVHELPDEDLLVSVYNRRKSAYLFWRAGQQLGRVWGSPGDGQDRATDRHPES